LIAIIFATYEEAQLFLLKVNATSEDEKNLYCFFIKGEKFLVAVSGMGLRAAEERCRLLIEHYGVKTIINAGVAGALNESYSIGDCFTVVNVINAEEKSCAINIESWPLLEESRLASISEGLFDDSKRRELSFSVQLVDMEGFAVAAVCKEKNAGCYIIKGVTDHASDGEKKLLKKNLPIVSEKLASIIYERLGELIETQDNIIQRWHKLTRLEHTLFSLPLLFAGAWLGAHVEPKFNELMLIILVGVGARTFGMTLNRILDKDLDAKNPRTWRRELPAGKVSTKSAMFAALFGLIAYFAGCAALGNLCLKLSIVPIIPLALYSLLKRFTSLCHFGIGLCLALAPLGAYVATSKSLPLNSDIIYLAGFTFFWMSGFDIIYSIMDITSDRITGVKSLPVKFGEKNAVKIASISHTIAFAFLFLLWLELGQGALAGLALFLTGLTFIFSGNKNIPIAVRFFPLSAIASGTASLVVLLR